MTLSKLLSLILFIPLLSIQQPFDVGINSLILQMKKLSLTLNFVQGCTRPLCGDCLVDHASDRVAPSPGLQQRRQSPLRLSAPSSAPFLAMLSLLVPDLCSHCGLCQELLSHLRGPFLPFTWASTGCHPFREVFITHLGVSLLSYPFVLSALETALFAYLTAFCDLAPH